MSLLGIVFVVVACLAMPILAIRSARQVERQLVKPTVPELLISTLITHGVVTALAIAAAHANAVRLFPPPSFVPTDALAGAIFLVLTILANIWHWRATSDDERNRLSWLRPQARRDIAAWAGVALIAGISEEIIYRGVLLGLIQSAVGDYWIAVAVCVAAFALGHWVQGRGAMLIVVLFAIGFHVLVRLTGDLYTAIIVHVVYDFAAGILLWWLGRRSSLTTSTPTKETSPIATS